jgi:hypothetical protein
VGEVVTGEPDQVAGRRGTVTLRSAIGATRILTQLRLLSMKAKLSTKISHLLLKLSVL